ncbi:MAG: glycosyltransferase [Nitrospirae bacterium]|nr:glycosyltransferase [Nitrospirota bacterium]
MPKIDKNAYPFVSIIIPVRNEEDYIQSCLHSVTKLDYSKEKYEVIVVDNNSTDSTREIVSRFNDVIVLEKKTGTIGTVRNFGARHARGEIIAFLDGDCVPDPQWLNIAITTLMTLRNVTVVGGIIALEKERSWIEEYWINYLNSKYQTKINYVSTISSFCFVIKKETMEDIGGFNEQLITCEDSDLGYRISQTGRKLIVHKDIKVNHLRNAKTSWEFFGRQLWQGRANLKSFVSHKFEVNELYSIVTPLFYLLLIAYVTLSFVLSSFYFNKWVLILLIAIPVIITLKQRVGRDKKCFPGYCYIWFLYLFARGLGMLIKIARWKS